MSPGRLMLVRGRRADHHVFGKVFLVFNPLSFKKNLKILSEFLQSKISWSVLLSCVCSVTSDLLHLCVSAFEVQASFVCSPSGVLRTLCLSGTTS